MDASGREEVASSRVRGWLGLALVLGAAFAPVGSVSAAEAGPVCTGLPEAALAPSMPGDEVCASVAGVRVKATQAGIDYGGGADSVLLPCDVARNLESLSKPLLKAGVKAVRLLPACSRDTRDMLRVVANLHGRVLRISALRLGDTWRSIPELSAAERDTLLESIPGTSRFRLVFDTASALHVELGWEHTAPPAWLARVRADAVAERLRPVMEERAKWGARPAQAERMPTHRDMPRTITVHHSAEELPGSVDARKRVRGLQGWSLRDKKWGDIPYHYTIDYQGRIYVNREERFVGDTNTAYDPDGHLLVHLLGNYDTRQPNAAQLEALERVSAWLAYRYDIPSERILGHGEHAETACPGKNLRKLIDDGTLRTAVQKRVARARR
ncbi:peptidoglycan recognition family protein [Pyxidicoccus trucidator]|uniref:peptidoglycan recognition protein family protein n=1 Tax=Pyxidicoccus trucidator TaxID=2709662 RepID=UPI0013DD4CF0|nr:peptidoglycan recognition family protein [Pyxidicoccus trucidator]